MTQNINYSNNPNSNFELAPLTNASTEGKLETVSKEIVEVLDNTLEVIEVIKEEDPISRWMEIASPILKSGGRTVAVILALGFISIPLMVSGSPWVALVLAIGASVTAIGSCL